MQGQSKNVIQLGNRLTKKQETIVRYTVLANRHYRRHQIYEASKAHARSLHHYGMYHKYKAYAEILGKLEGK